MRLSWPRFTIRRLMIALAILAVILASTIRMMRLSSRYQFEANQAAFRAKTSRQRADMHERMEKNHRENLRIAREELAKPMYRSPEWREFLSGSDPLGVKFHESNSQDSATKGAAEKRLMDYWQTRKERYLRAARYPWLSIEPDTPEPK